MNNRYWELLAKYVAGEASDREVEMIAAWVKADPARRELLEDMKRSWEATRKERFPRTDVEAAWDKLEARIEEEEAGSTSPFRETRRDREARRGRHERTPRRRSRRVPRHLVQAAGGVAMVLAIVLAVVLWSNPGSKVIVTQRGERSTIELVDGTRVHLNAESEIAVLPGFGRGTREVRLDGEAYFSVAHDEDRPFRVHTPEGVIQVVGTAFNVNAYDDRRGARVAVTEGAVALHVRKTVQAAGVDTVVLRPHHLGVMADQRLDDLQRDVDVTSHVAWKEGRLVFEDAPFREVVQRLERWYDLRIEMPRDYESIDRLNAVFDRESVREVLSDIAVALDLQYEQEGDKIVFSREANALSKKTLPAG